MVDDDLLRQLDATLARNAQAFEDLQLVIRESRLREERTLQHFGRNLERMNDRFDASFAEVRDSMRQMRAELRAHTEAVWSMLERWGEGPTPTS